MPDTPALDAEIVHVDYKILALEKRIQSVHSEATALDTDAGSRVPPESTLLLSPIARMWSLVRQARRSQQDAQRTKLSVKLLRLRETRRDLCKRRNNTVSALCRLPAEIQIQIVRGLVDDYCALMPSGVLFGCHMTPIKPHWPRVRQVCSVLNATVLACPILWSNVHFALESPWTALHTSCVGSRSLFMSYADDGGIRPVLANLAVLPRPVNHARVYLSKPFEELHAAVGQMLPHLRSLVYSVRSGAAPVSASWVPHQPPVLRSLTQLVLRGVTLSVQGLQFPNLVHLELERVWVEDGPAPLFTLLRASPHLEFLRLHTRFTRQVLYCPSLRASLPALRTLHLGCDHLDATVLINALPAPADTFHVTTHDTHPRLHFHDYTRIPLLFSGTPVVDISDRHYIRVDHVGIHTPRVCFTGVVRGVEHEGHSVLEHTQKLRVGTDIAFFFTIPAKILHALVHLEIPKACVSTHGRDLLGWFRQRAETRRALHTVNFYGDQATNYSLYALESLEEDILAMGAVEFVLHDGREVGRRRSTE
jgi:hypothetical protein